MCEIIQYLSFSVGLISLNIMPSRFILCSCKWQDFLLFYGWIIFHCVCHVGMYHVSYHIFFIHLSIDGQLGFFHVLSVVNNATVNMGCSYLFKIVISFPLEIPEVELLVHMLVLVLNFWGTSILFSTVAVPVYISTNSAWGFPFLYILTTTYLLSFW